MNKGRNIRDELYEYADAHTGYIAKLTYDAGCYIDYLLVRKASLERRVRELEKEREDMTDDGK